MLEAAGLAAGRRAGAPCIQRGDAMILLRTSFDRHGILRSIFRFCITSGGLSLAMAQGGTPPTQVYKSRDAKGTLIYSDQPPTGPAQRILIAPAKGNPGKAAAGQQQRQAAWEAADRDRKARTEQAAKDQAALAEERSKKCREARYRQMEFSTDRPHYRFTERGERNYYSAAEIDRERAEAQARMNEFCEKRLSGK